jgi:L-amino acid N-acyltransferase YncA
MRRTTGEDEVVERKCSDIRRHGFAIEVYRFHTSQKHANVQKPREHGTYGSGNIGGTEAGHGNLIQERLKQVVIASIDQRDFNVVDSSQTFRRIDTGKTTTHDDDPFHAIPLRVNMPSMIRNANESDLPDIVNIYNAAIPGRLATADTEPVSLKSRQSWFHDRDFSRHPIWVCENSGNDGQIQGWLSFKPFYGRPAYSATAEVSIYVDPAAQRAGVATRLMEQAILSAPELHLTTYLAFVFAHNHPSLALCRKFGFEEWGHLPRIAVLDGTDRDLLILGRRL